MTELATTDSDVPTADDDDGGDNKGAHDCSKCEDTGTIEKEWQGPRPPERWRNRKYTTFCDCERGQSKERLAKDRRYR